MTEESCIQTIPFFHSYDTERKQLTLRGASHFPEQLFDHSDQIEILDVSQGTLREVPKGLDRLTKLRIVFFSQNPIVEIPEWLSACNALELAGFKSCKIERISEEALPSQLRWLILTDNRLQSLPASMGKLERLQKLALAANRLRSLPQAMEGCRSLQLLRLAANSFENAPPEWLFDLPALAWYGDAGNPFCESLRVTDDLPVIAAHDLFIGAQIGKSPSSNVFRAQMRDGREVALKNYLGKFTSDGYAHDDIRAAIGAGTHPHLVQVIGKYEGTVTAQASLLLDLIPPEYRTLGLPPSLLTCTRDEFAPETSFSVPFTLEALRCISSALEHLHRRGITHGDLYAHNILTNAAGRSILGDFGAASFFEPRSGEARVQVETCAVGHLIEDLLLRLSEGSESSAAQALKALHAVCVQPKRQERPDMAEVGDELRKIVEAS